MQYDLTAIDIFSTVDTVAFWNGYSSAFGNLYFNFLQLAPNGKIYGVYNGGDSTMTVIDNPNALGNNCNVIQQGVQLLSYNSTSIPNIPNFRLGPIDGSLCDTLGIDNIIVSSENRKPKSADIHIYPNPTNDILNIEYVDFQNKKIIVTDILGRTQKILPLQSETTNINLSNFSNGIYYLSIYENNRLVGSTKFVVLHE